MSSQGIPSQGALQTLSVQERLKQTDIEFNSFAQWGHDVSTLANPANPLNTLNTNKNIE